MASLSIMNFDKRLGSRSAYLIWLAIILATASPASADWKEKVLYSFQGDLSPVTLAFRQEYTGSRLEMVCPESSLEYLHAF